MAEKQLREAKRVLYASDAAMKAFMDYLTDNLDHP